MIENFDVSCFKPVSYELRLGSVSILAGKGSQGANTLEKEVPILQSLTLPYNLNPMEYVIGKSIEKLNLPSNLMAIVVPTSYAIRVGIGVNSGKIDPTYRGEVSFGVQNLTKHDVELKKGLRLVHLLVSEFKGETIPLETKYFGVELK